MFRHCVTFETQYRTFILAVVRDTRPKVIMQPSQMDVGNFGDRRKYSSAAKIVIPEEIISAIRFARPAMNELRCRQIGSTSEVCIVFVLLYLGHFRSSLSDGQIHVWVTRAKPSRLNNMRDSSDLPP